MKNSFPNIENADIALRRSIKEAGRKYSLSKRLNIVN
jgi:hypothetical protein